MDPLTLITAAKGIAKLTGLDDWVTEKLGGKAASKIAEIAQQVAGAHSPQEVLERLENDSELVVEIRLKLLDQQHKINMAMLEDVQDARKTYREADHTQADKIADRVIKQNHWLVFLMLVINGFAYVFIVDKTAALAVGNATGFSINALWSERQQVIGFFFGSSLGSKLKDGFKNASSHTEGH